MSQTSLTSPRVETAELLYNAITSAGKAPAVVAYGSLQSAHEWRDRVGNESADVPQLCKVAGLRRVYTTADSRSQPARARLFVDRNTRRVFRGRFAVLGVDDGNGMDAALGRPPDKAGFLRVVESEVSYYPEVVSNADITDPRTGRPLEDDHVAIVFRQFPSFRQGFLNEAKAKQCGLPTNGMVVRDGYLEKTLEPIERIGQLRNGHGDVVWDCMPELRKLFGLDLTPEQSRFGDERPASYAPPVGEIDLVPIRRNPDFHAYINSLTYNKEAEKVATLALLTDEGLAKAQPRGLGIAQYLRPIAAQLPLIGASTAAIQDVMAAISREPLAA
jgi:hypothetical protein